MSNSFSQALERQEARTHKRLSKDLRRTKILQAAKKIFFTKGYTGSSIDDIIRLSGGSRRSLYTLFVSKKGLFNALLAETSLSIFKILDGLDAAPMTTEAVLVRSGELLLTQLFTEEWNFMRLVIMESVSNPELGRLYHENGPKRVEAKLTELLQKASDRDDVGFADCHEVSAIFVGMLRNTVYTQFLFDMKEIPCAETIQRTVQKYVHVLLHGLAQANIASK